MPGASILTRICQPPPGAATAQSGRSTVSLSATRAIRSSGSSGPPGAPATCAGRQLKVREKNAQGSVSARLLLVREQFLYGLAVGAGLLLRDEAVAGQHGRRDDEAGRLDVA